jgi:acyl carrier protein
MSESKKIIRAFFADAFEGRELGDDDDVFGNGYGNSLFAMQLVEFVEERFGIELVEDDLDVESFRTVSRIAALVERKVDQPVAS